MNTLSLCVVALFIGLVRCAVPTFDYFSACDDSQHVYSGHSLGVDELGSLDNWKGTLQLKVPTVTKVLAVSCRNKGGPAGILGSTNDGRILTNSQWKCSNTFEENWNSANFDDSNWAPGVQVDTNVAPGPVHHGWKVREQIDSKAVWISSQKSDIPADTTVYCRLKLVFEFIMVCDDNSTLYADGIWIGTQGTGGARNTAFNDPSNPLEIPKMATVFAVACQNAGGYTGFLGSTKSGALLTDSQWKVHNINHKKFYKYDPVLPDGWFEPEYDDSDWTNALVIVDNKDRTSQPYASWVPKLQKSISTDAVWIGAVAQPLIKTGDKDVDKKDISVLLLRRKLDCLWTKTCLP